MDKLSPFKSSVNREESAIRIFKSAISALRRKIMIILHEFQQVVI